MIKSDLLRGGSGVLFLLLTVFLIPEAALSSGSPAGTAIINTAVLSYDYGDGVVVPPINSNTTTTIVEEVLDLHLVRAGTSNILVSPGDDVNPLTFVLTNKGNGSEAFGLEVENSLGED